MAEAASLAPRRIGLMGGSFDPPHLGHLDLGRTAVAQLQLQCLHWLPAGNPWQKAGRAMASGADRAGMLRALLQGEPGHQVDERELQRQGPTYTIDTVRAFERAPQPEAGGDGGASPQLFLVIGQDQYARFDTWRDWQAILDRVTLAVAAREGVRPQPPAALADHPHRVVVLAMPRRDVSSTAIRERLRAGEPPAALVPLVGAGVADYIQRHGLYRPDAASASSQPPNR